ncbi:MAG: hypothetical protein II482_00520 [Lachnospiraceae bacterium]|nr:hypothetical protein [Lachnospiraceae bacterium]
MKGRKRSSVFTGALLVLAIAALLFGGIGSARAVLTPSDEYIADIGTKDIALVLNENGDAVEEGGELLSGLIAEGDSVKIGQMYDESLTVKNTGTIDQYVRVSVYKYWTEEGKRTDLDPALIKLKFGKGWVEDKSASTPERTVLYCTKKVAVGKETAPFVTNIGVDPSLGTMVEQTTSEDGKTITTTFKYDDLKFNLEVSVDGIQDHNAADAAKSAWGVDASQFIPGL